MSGTTTYYISITLVGTGVIFTGSFVVDRSQNPNIIAFYEDGNPTNILVPQNPPDTYWDNAFISKCTYFSDLGVSINSMSYYTANPPMASLIVPSEDAQTNLIIEEPSTNLIEDTQPNMIIEDASSYTMPVMGATTATINDTSSYTMPVMGATTATINDSGIEEIITNTSGGPGAANTSGNSGGGSTQATITRTYNILGEYITFDLGTGSNYHNRYSQTITTYTTPSRIFFLHSDNKITWYTLGIVSSSNIDGSGSYTYPISNKQYLRLVFNKLYN